MKNLTESEEMPIYGKNSQTDIETVYTYQVQRLRAELKDTGMTAPQITSSRCVANALRNAMADEELAIYEAFYVMLLTRGMKPISVAKISQGGVAGTVVDIKLILKHALISSVNCAAIVVCHNHPSGNLAPSQSDKDRTIEIKNACKIFDIALLDHIILSGINESFFSFADESML